MLSAVRPSTIAASDIPCASCDTGNFDCDSLMTHLVAWLILKSQRSGKMPECDGKRTLFGPVAFADTTASQKNREGCREPTLHRRDFDMFCNRALAGNAGAGCGCRFCQ